MVSFREVNQARISLKMPLSNYSWFKSISIESEGGQYYITVTASHVDNAVKDAVPSFHKGVSVKLEAET